MQVNFLESNNVTSFPQGSMIQLRCLFILLVLVLLQL